MARNSIIKLPNGVIIEISADFKPEQINTIITSVMSGNSFELSEKEIAKIEIRTAEEIWSTSKKEKVALFIRNYFISSWFSAKELLEVQLQVVRAIAFGETSQIGTYLKRLNEENYLERKTYGRLVKYKVTQILLDEYPLIKPEQMNDLIIDSI